jgi:hypothetical protein
MNDYSDIINLPHYEPKHPRMSRYQRAAQFAPFAALTGYEDEIKEVSRTTNKRIEYNEELYQELNNTINYLLSIIDNKPFIEITYFVPDQKKSGGEYLTKQGNIKRIDIVNQFIKFTDNTLIDLNEILIIKVIDKIK